MTKKGLFIGLVSIMVLSFIVPPISSAYQETSVTSGGTIKGTVIYNGTVPMKKVIPTKDSEICGGIRNEPQVVVGTGSGVKDAIVYLKGIAEGKRWVKPKKTPEINNIKCRFEPHVQVVPVRSKVVIINSDPVLHNTHGFLGKPTVFNVAMPRKGMRVERPLRRPGLVRVECDAHGWMLAWIYVADSPYYAVSGSNGAFAITDVPPGKYVLHTWQEYTGTTETPVTVEPNGTVSLTIEIKK